MSIDSSALYRKALKEPGHLDLALAAESQRKQALQNLAFLHDRDIKIGDTVLAERAAAVRQRMIAAVLKYLDFRLVGFLPLEGDPGARMFETVNVRDDIMRSILAVERKYVIDPARLKVEFASATAESRIDAVTKETRSSLSEEGFQAYLADMEKLVRVHREGVLISAEIALPSGRRIPVGYTYALDEMPLDDPQFQNLSYRTLGLPEELKSMLIPDPRLCQAIWRTTSESNLPVELLPELGLQGIEPTSTNLSLRRMGIASALKYIIIQLGRFRRKILTTLNVGTLLSTKEMIRLPNSASFVYNTNILGQHWGIRNVIDGIVLEEGEKREIIARMIWTALGDTTDAAIQHLEAENGPIIRHGIDPQKLLLRVEEILGNIRLMRAA